MRKLSTFMLVLMLLLGAAFFVYPDVASWWNGRIQRGIVDEYIEAIARTPRNNIEGLLEHARTFNDAIQTINIHDPFADTEYLPTDYLRTLNVNGIMAVVEIPSIDVVLPVRHGTGYRVLDIGAGHLVGTHLPIGGYNTHSVITAHSGLSNARMFTDMLDGQVGIGDYFFINVLGLRLAYQVIQLDTVYPHDIDLIQIYPGEDLVTLITCTPLAINTHRLLVRGERVPYIQGMADYIEPIMNIVQRNWRIFVAIGAFVAFILFFSLYQLIRIIMGRYLQIIDKLRREIEQGPTAAADPYIPIQQRPRTVLTEDELKYIDPKNNRTEIEDRKYRAAEKRRRQQREARRRVSAFVAMILLVVGGAVILWPAYQFRQFDRQAEVLIEEWQERLDIYRENIREMWHEESAQFIDAIADLPVAYNGDIYVAPNGDVHIRTVLQVLPNGAHVYAPTLILASNGTDISMTPSGYLRVNGTNVGTTGVISISDLIVGPSGDLYISYNGNQLSVRDLTRDEDGNIYLGNIYLGDAALYIPPQLEEDYDLDLIFNLDPETDDPFHWLTDVIREYNRVLYETNAVEDACLDMMEDVDFSLEERARFTDEMIGFMTIEAIDVRLPIFSGSSHINMLRGLAHLSHSSLPVGGINTNAVITGHRGLSNARMFRHIDRLQNGDIIQITNFYETLTYRVFGQQVILPHESEALRVRPGKDMITIFSCEPYRVNTHRILVFAQRVH